MTTNDLKDRTIKELRTEVMTKVLKIETLKLRIKTLEGDIAEFINEFGRLKQFLSKKPTGTHTLKT